MIEISKQSYVVKGATLSCTLGTSVSNLNIPISHGVFLKNKRQANSSDHIPYINIPVFGNCLKSNPPPPCTPSTPNKWLFVKDDVIIGNDAALLNTSICMCGFGGVISIKNDGQ